MWNWLVRNGWGFYSKWKMKSIVCCAHTTFSDSLIAIHQEIRMSTVWNRLNVSTKMPLPVECRCVRQPDRYLSICLYRRQCPLLDSYEIRAIDYIARDFELLHLHICGCLFLVHFFTLNFIVVFFLFNISFSCTFKGFHLINRQIFKK